MQPVTLDAVLTGTPQPLGPKAVPSSIASRVPAVAPVMAGPLGFTGDAVGDGAVHGGPDKAIHLYPRDHYDHWAAEQPAMVPLLVAPGAFGENLSARGLGEEDVCLGDIVRAGGALLQLTQTRQPCWKLGVRFGLPTLPRLVQKTGRTGWYYRVLEGGAIGPGDSLTLVERPNPGWSLSRTLHLLYVDTLDRDALAALAELAGISAALRKTARTRLETLTVEDWARRLDGASA